MYKYKFTYCTLILSLTRDVPKYSAVQGSKLTLSKCQLQVKKKKNGLAKQVKQICMPVFSKKNSSPDPYVETHMWNIPHIMPPKQKIWGKKSKFLCFII